MQTKTKIPLWVLGIAAVLGLLDLGGGLGGYFAAESMLETVDLSVTEAWFVVKSWAARNVAMAMVMAYAIWQRTKPALTMAFVLHLIVFLLDAGMGFMRPAVGPEVAPMGLLFAASSLLCIWWINR